MDGSPLLSMPSSSDSLPTDELVAIFKAARFKARNEKATKSNPRHVAPERLPQPSPVPLDFLTILAKLEISQAVEKRDLSSASITGEDKLVSQPWPCS